MEETRWHVLHVRPRCEKKMVEHSQALGLSHYLPLRRETKVYQRRKVMVEKPVFPGYFFASFNREGRVGLLKTNQVVRVLDPVDQRILLHQLAQVRRALRTDPTLMPCDALRKGRMVRITGGPFMGVEGAISEVHGTAKVRLNVEMIGQAVAVEVDKDFLEFLD